MEFGIVANRSKSCAAICYIYPISAMLDSSAGGKVWYLGLPSQLSNKQPNFFFIVGHIKVIFILDPIEPKPHIYLFNV